LLGALPVEFKYPLSGKDCLVALSSRIEAETLAKIIRSNGGAATVFDGPGLLPTNDELKGSNLLIDVRLMRQMLANGADFKDFKNRVILIEPSERGSMAEFHKLGFETYLVRPVRQKTLVRRGADYAIKGPSSCDKRSQKRQQAAFNIGCRRQ
jgi:hypothetical protein